MVLGRLWKFGFVKKIKKFCQQNIEQKHEEEEGEGENAMREDEGEGENEGG